MGSTFTSAFLNKTEKQSKLHVKELYLYISQVALTFFTFQIVYEFKINLIETIMEINNLSIETFPIISFP